MRKSTVLIWIVSLGLVLSSFTIACSSGDDKQQTPTQQGVLPILMAGDTWTLDGFKFDDIECTMTVNIIGEDVIQDKDCYLAEVIVDPPIIPITTAKIDKATLDNLQMQSSGNIGGMPFSSDTTFSYTYSQKPFPISVGKMWEETKTGETISIMMGETDTTTKTEKSTYKVESLEEITVPSGTFDCFRIVKYGENNQKLNTYWYSGEAKSNIKEIDHKTDEIRELISYTINNSH